MDQTTTNTATHALTPVARSETDASPRARAPLSAAAQPTRQRGRAGKRVVLGLLVLAVIGALIVALRPQPIGVEAAVATRGLLRVTVDEDGIARIQDRYVVSAPIVGHLARIEHTAGDEVRHHETLARLMPITAPLLDERTRSEAQARLAMSLAAQQQSAVQVERAVLRYEFSKDDAARKHELESSGAVAHELVEQADLALRTSVSELESLRFGLQVATHEADMARAALGQLTGHNPREQLEIKSPVDGKILRVMHESEGVTQPGTPLLELGDAKALEIAVDVLTSDAVRIKPASVVLFERWGGATLEGRVRRVEPSAFTRVSALGVEEQRVNVIIDLTSPRSAWAALGDGYRVEAHIVVWEGQDALTVPSSAVFRHDDGWATFRIVKGVVKLTPVTLGERTPYAVQIAGGLTAGEHVVLHPSDQVREGVEVSER